ncbi:MAG: spermidine synthase [Candidatus Magasanikbacteria bacterium]|nr:spermidine synthase [Candidatus Magasanikbacteria bacterium]NCS72187.1 spermidine synthase [Candidatus Magasanikbacteria bacterium]
MQRYLLGLVVFFSGALVMIFEIAGTRLLAPYVGTSMYIWTSLIGIILGSLSLGYFVGGRLADSEPSIRILSGILALGGLFVEMTLFTVSFVVGLSEGISDLRLRAVVLSLFLFAPASVCLGMVSPYVAKLALHDLHKTGKTMGNLSALSTMGSIAGTFLAGFVLLPLVGVKFILICIAACLVILSFLCAIHKKWLILGGFVPLLFLIFSPTSSLYSAGQNDPVSVSVESAYSHIMVFDSVHNQTGRPIRSMRINNESSSAMFLDGDDLVYEYTKFYRLANHFAPTLSRALMLGGAAYSYPKDFLDMFPEATLDVVEIDPAVTKLSRAYFSLPTTDRLHIFHEDGRTFLHRSTDTYDVIFGDAFLSLYSIPYQLTTKEAVEEMYRLLDDDGIVLTNVISSVEGDKGKFLRAEYETYASVFPHVEVFPVRTNTEGDRRQNIILFASKSDKPLVFENADEELQSYLSQRWTRPIPHDVPVLTDDFAPVEYYSLLLTQ